MKNSIKKVFYIIGGIVCLIAAVIISIGLWKFIRWGVFLAVGFGAFGLSIPFLIRHGLKTLYKERAYITNILSRNVEIHYSYGKILRGFTEVLILFWLMVPATFLIPAGVLTAVVLIPSTVAMFVVEMRVSEIWEDIGWKKGHYWLMNISIYIVGIILGYCLKVILY